MDVLDVIGNFGRFQKEMFLLISIRSMILVFSFYVIHMAASNVDHWCAPVDTLHNMTSEDWKQCCVPIEDGKYSQCQRYQVDEYGVVENDTLVDCHAWEYDRSVIKSSLKTEFNLVCDRKWLVSIMYAMFFTGNLVCYPFAGYFCDRFGRRRSILFGLSGMAVFNTALAFSVSFEMFLACRVIGACFYTFVMSSTVTLFLEISGRRQRSMISLFTGGVWGIANCIALVVSTVLSDWRMYIMIGSFPLILPYLLLCCKFLKESPRWLVAKGRYDQARAVLDFAAKKNGIIIHDMDSVIKALQEKIESGANEHSASSLKEFFLDKRLTGILSLVVFSFAVNRFLANGFYVTLRNLSGNFHMNFAISSTLNVVASIFNSFVQSYITRRRLMLITTFGLCGAGFLITTALGEDMKWVRVAVAMSAKFSNKITSTALMLYLTEVIPTKLRARGTSICHTVGRVGALISSFTDLLNQTYGPNASYFLFGSVSIFASICYIFVPDMDNTKLPDTVADTKRNVGNKDPVKSKEENGEIKYSALPVA